MPDDPPQHPPDDRPYLPAMGRDWMLPFYDPFTRLLGARSAHRRLIAQAGIEPGHRVLEIGCGTGNLALLVKRDQPGATVVGLDPDPAALDLARRKAHRAGLVIDLDRGFADDLPYPDAGFDRVLSAFMFHHLPAAARAGMLTEVRRVLAPGGSLHLLDLTGPGRSLGAVNRALRLAGRLHAGLGDQHDHTNSHGHGHGHGHGHDASTAGGVEHSDSPQIVEQLAAAGFTGVTQTGRGRGRGPIGDYAWFRATI